MIQIGIVVFDVGFGYRGRCRIENSVFRKIILARLRAVIESDAVGIFRIFRELARRGRRGRIHLKIRRGQVEFIPSGAVVIAITGHHLPLIARGIIGIVGKIDDQHGFIIRYRLALAAEGQELVDTHLVILHRFDPAVAPGRIGQGYFVDISGQEIAEDQIIAVGIDRIGQICC